MKPKTKNLLRQLLESNTPASIVNLQKDLSVFDADQFRTELEKLAGLKTKRKPRSKPAAKRKRRSVPSDDSPSSRIAHVLRVSKNLSDEDAAVELEKALLKEGVSPQKIKKRGRKKLENWIEELTENISSSVVMHAAMKI